MQESNASKGKNPMDETPLRIDSHQHFWAINDSDYVWMTDAHDRIRRDFLPHDLDPLLAGNDLAGCIAVQARQMIEETRWLLDLSAHHARIQGVVGWVPLADGAGEPFLEQFCANPRLVGVRHVIHDEPDPMHILRPDFNEGIARLLNYGMVYDILIFQHHLPQTIEFVDRHPEQIFVVDHVAKPRILTGAFDHDWAINIRRLAERTNVNCKLSGMVTEVRDKDWNTDLLRPYFDTVLSAFGPDRLLFGSDWPVCLIRADYAAWVHAARELTGALSPSEQSSIWGETARRVYGLP
jgi:L-fuconolactonase